MGEGGSNSSNYSIWVNSSVWRKYEVKSLKLISEDSDIDFEQYRTTGFAKISKVGFKRAWIH